MKEDRCQYESSSKGASRGVRGDTGAMGVSMEDCKQPHNCCCTRNRQLCPESDHGPKHDCRCRYCVFDDGQRLAGDAERAAQCHERYEGCGNKPDRPATELPCQETYRYHHKDVVEAAERMRKPFPEAVGMIRAEMSERRRRREQENCNEHLDGAGTHGWLSY